MHSRKPAVLPYDVAELLLLYLAPLCMQRLISCSAALSTLSSKALDEITRRLHHTTFNWKDVPPPNFGSTILAPTLGKVVRIAGRLRLQHGIVRLKTSFVDLKMPLRTGFDVNPLLCTVITLMGGDCRILLQSTSTLDDAHLLCSTAFRLCGPLSLDLEPVDPYHPMKWYPQLVALVLRKDMATTLRICNIGAVWSPHTLQCFSTASRLKIVDTGYDCPPHEMIHAIQSNPNIVYAGGYCASSPFKTQTMLSNMFWSSFHLPISIIPAVVCNHRDYLVRHFNIPGRWYLNLTDIPDFHSVTSRDTIQSLHPRASLMLPMDAQIDKDIPFETSFHGTSIERARSIHQSGTFDLPCFTSPNFAYAAHPSYAIPFPIGVHIGQLIFEVHHSTRNYTRSQATIPNPFMDSDRIEQLHNIGAVVKPHAIHVLVY